MLDPDYTLFMMSYPMSCLISTLLPLYGFTFSLYCIRFKSFKKIIPFNRMVDCSILFSSSFAHFELFFLRYEKIMNEMLGHLERQPRDKERRIAWLRFIEPLLNALGLFLLAHFRRIFPLFFQWMHSDDAETVLLVGTCSSCNMLVLILTFLKINMNILLPANIV